MGGHGQAMGATINVSGKPKGAWIKYKEFRVRNRIPIQNPMSVLTVALTVAHVGSND